MTPESQSRIAELRAKSLSGSLTADDIREFVRIQRAGRQSAAHASENSKRKKAKKQVKTADELLKELDSLQ